VVLLDESEHVGDTSSSCVSDEDIAHSDFIARSELIHGESCWCQDCLEEPVDLHAEALSDDEGILTISECDDWMQWTSFGAWEPWPLKAEADHGKAQEATIFW
jgi:hypothetical protein